jgi:hypothetical protein
MTLEIIITNCWVEVLKNLCNLKILQLFNLNLLCNFLINVLHHRMSLILSFDLD